jgi:hypothetical protein
MSSASPAFTDRAWLVGVLASRAVFVFLYGGFIESARPH